MGVYSTGELGSVGFISEDDRKADEVPKEAITGGRNVRCENGAVEPVRGFINVLEPTFTSIWADWANNGGAYWWLLFDTTKAYSYNGTEYIDVTGLSGFNVTPGTNFHSTDRFHGVLCVTDGINHPQAQYNSGSPASTDNQTIFIDLPGWPAGEVCNHIIAHKNYLIALNITTAIQALPGFFRWSNAAVPGRLPDTWIPAPENDASALTPVGDDSGAIVGVELLGDDVIIYCDNGIYRLQYVGGEEIYRVDRIFKARGMFGPRCVAEFRRRHYVITDDDIIVHDGVNIRSIAEGRVKKFLQSKLTDDNKLWVMMYGHRAEKEIGIAYSNGEEGRPIAGPANESITYNVLADALTNHDDPTSRVWNTPQDEPSIYWKREMPDLDFTQQDGVRWDDETGIPQQAWNVADDIPALATVGDLLDSFDLFGGEDNAGIVYQFNVGNLMQWSGNLNPGSYPVCEMIQYDQNLNGLHRTARTDKLFCYMRSDAAIEIEQGYQWAVNEAYTWEGPYTFDPNTEQETDLNTEGLRVALKFRVDDGTRFRLSRYDMSWIDTGRY